MIIREKSKDRMFSCLFITGNITYFCMPVKSEYRLTEDSHLGNFEILFIYVYEKSIIYHLSMYNNKLTSTYLLIFLSVSVFIYLLNLSQKP